MVKSKDLYEEYVRFCISHILVERNDFDISELDTEFERCSKLAEKFINGAYDDNANRDFMSCLDDFINDYEWWRE